MSTPESSQSAEILLSGADLDRAAAAGVVSAADIERLKSWARSESTPPGRAPRTEQSKGFNLVTVLYYFGAMLMISACAWFLGDKWDVLQAPGIMAIVLCYMIIAFAAGAIIRRYDYIVAGGLLITVGVSLTPLLVYSIERIIGWWPSQDPGAYKDFYPFIHASWIMMEIATILAAAVALWFVRFGFLTAPMAFCFWFLSMDLAALIVKQNSLESQPAKWISVGVGAFMILLGFVLERFIHTRENRVGDYAFWCYLFGLMAFWGALTSMDSGSEAGRFLYLLVNIGLVGLALWLTRTVFLVFGGMGIYIYLGHLAWVVFRDSFFFPFVLALFGLILILGTVFGQHYWRQRLKRLALSQPMETSAGSASV
ncbi:MAG TPA: hypothetical protein VE961_08515 [Pyrinomonadaceae bacterium]|nr:hypothetical protein [Pyrinomonadaceae bacterium]